MHTEKEQVGEVVSSCLCRWRFPSRGGALGQVVQGWSPGGKARQARPSARHCGYGVGVQHQPGVCLHPPGWPAACRKRSLPTAVLCCFGAAFLFTLLMKAPLMSSCREEFKSYFLCRREAGPIAKFFLSTSVWDAETEQSLSKAAVWSSDRSAGGGCRNRSSEWDAWWLGNIIGPQLKCVCGADPSRVHLSLCREAHPVQWGWEDVCDCLHTSISMPWELCPPGCTQMWLSWNVPSLSAGSRELFVCCGHKVGPVVKLLRVLIAKSEMLILHRLKYCSISPSTSRALLQGKIPLLRQALRLQFVV